MYSWSGRWACSHFTMASTVSGGCSGSCIMRQVSFVFVKIAHKMGSAGLKQQVMFDAAARNHVAERDLAQDRTDIEIWQLRHQRHAAQYAQPVERSRAHDRRRRQEADQSCE